MCAPLLLHALCLEALRQWWEGELGLGPQIPRLTEAPPAPAVRPLPWGMLQSCHVPDHRDDLRSQPCHLFELSLKEGSSAYWLPC